MLGSPSQDPPLSQILAFWPLPDRAGPKGSLGPMGSLLPRTQDGASLGHIPQAPLLLLLTQERAQGNGIYLNHIPGLKLPAQRQRPRRRWGDPLLGSVGEYRQWSSVATATWGPRVGMGQLKARLGLLWLKSF